jgi:endonuclease/exonuclease/phosphatase family metal-dependent hydrolase
VTCAASFLLAAVTVGTWNGEWFPSGRAEHRAAPEVEAATIAAAGRMLREGLDRADPAGTNDVIICLNEMRGPKAAKLLCEATGRTNLSVVSISAYRRRDRFDMQQDAIATTLPVAHASWSKWRSAKGDTPPRGYAHAMLVLSPAVTAAVYSVHLKSNYGQTTEELAVRNRKKRSVAVSQLIDIEEKFRGRNARPAIIAGDFNADAWRTSFAKETIFADLATAGYVNVLSALPPDGRATYETKGKWGNSALDYIMLKGLKTDAPPVIVPSGGVSDHNPVFVNVEVPPDPSAPRRSSAKKGNTTEGA